MVCKAAQILALCLCCMAWLRLYAAAYAPEEIVGQPGMLLAAMSGNGSLSDESVMGDALADAIRQRAGAELAIVPGCAMTGNLEPKPQTYADVCAVLAEPEEPVVMAAVSAAGLREMLEAGVAAVVLDEREAIDREASAFGGFPQVSGFTFVYDASARPGERVTHIRMNGRELDPEDGAVYTFAAPESLLQGAWRYPPRESEPVGASLAEALADYIAAGTGDAYTGEGRIAAVGCTDDSIVNRFPLVTCVLAAIVIWLGARLWKFKYFDRTTR